MNVYLLMSKPPRYDQYIVDSAYGNLDDARDHVRRMIGRLGGDPTPGANPPAARSKRKGKYAHILSPDGRRWSQFGEMRWRCFDDGHEMYIESHKISSHVDYNGQSIEVSIDAVS